MVYIWYQLKQAGRATSFEEFDFELCARHINSMTTRAFQEIHGYLPTAGGKEKLITACRSSRLFESLSGTRTLKAQEVLWERGGKARACYLIVSGYLRIDQYHHERSRNEFLTLLGPSDIAGISTLLTGSKRNTSAVAVTHLEYIQIEREEFFEQLERDERFMYVIMDEFIKHKKIATDRLRFSQYRGVVARIIIELFYLAERFGVENYSGKLLKNSRGVFIPISLTKSQLREMVKTCHSSTSTYLADLERRELILFTHEGIVINDKKKLLAEIKGAEVDELYNELKFGNQETLEVTIESE